MTDEVKKMILKYGENKKKLGNRIKSAEVICNGCGKKIRSDDPDVGDIEYSLTKRKTFYAFHRKCFRKTWDSKIK